MTITWDNLRHAPFGVAKRTVRLDTPTQLRQWVAAARADPHVVSYHYDSVREMVGSVPTQCGHGHPLDGGTANRATRSWLACDCGGHVAYACRLGDCREQVIDPVPQVGCVPVAAHSLASASQ